MTVEDPVAAVKDAAKRGLPIRITYTPYNGEWMCSFNFYESYWAPTLEEAIWTAYKTLTPK